MHRFWNDGFNDMMNFNNRDFGWLIFNGLLAVLITVIVVAFIVRLFAKTSNNQKTTTSNRAIEILKERYATGEISDEEYKSILKNLKD